MEEEAIRESAWDFIGGMTQYASFARKAENSILKAIIEAIEKDEDVMIDVTDVEQAEEDFAKRVGDMHRDFSPDLGYIVESWIAPCDLTIEGEEVKKGSWLLGVIWSQEQFDKIASGERTGYSLGGRGLREEVR